MILYNISEFLLPLNEHCHIANIGIEKDNSVADIKI